MAKFTIVTSEKEQEEVLKALKQINGATASVSTIAKTAGLPISRTRYALIDLEDAGKIKKEATRAFNRHYVRYAYKILTRV